MNPKSVGLGLVRNVHAPIPAIAWEVLSYLSSYPARAHPTYTSHITLLPV